MCLFVKAVENALNDVCEYERCSSGKDGGHGGRWILSAIFLCIGECIVGTGVFDVLFDKDFFRVLKGRLNKSFLSRIADVDGYVSSSCPDQAIAVRHKVATTGSHLQVP